MFLNQQIEIAEKEAKGKKGISLLRRKVESNEFEFVFIESTKR